MSRLAQKRQHTADCHLSTIMRQTSYLAFLIELEMYVTSGASGLKWIRPEQSTNMSVIPSQTQRAAIIVSAVIPHIPNDEVCNMHDRAGLLGIHTTRIYTQPEMDQVSTSES